MLDNHERDFYTRKLNTFYLLKIKAGAYAHPYTFDLFLMYNLKYYFYFQLVIFTFFCLNILQTNAGISAILRDTGVIPAVPMTDLKETA